MGEMGNTQGIISNKLHYNMGLIVIHSRLHGAKCSLNLWDAWHIVHPTVTVDTHRF